MLPPAAVRENRPGAGALSAGAGATTEAWKPWLDVLLRGALILLATLWIYSPASRGDWLWDDDVLLTANPTVQSGSLAGLWKLWFDPDGVDYFPLSYSAFWLQWPFFGADPAGYHTVSILFHAAGALLLWRLLVVMRIPGGWLAALLFAVHPACVESVAWVSELKNTLSLPPFLLSAICFVRHDDAARATDPGAARRSLGFHALSVAWFLVAMLAKTSMVMFPVVLLVHAWWRRGRIGLRDLAAAAPFFLVSLVLGMVTIHYQHGRAIGAEKIPIADPFTLAGVVERVLLSGMALVFYLWTAFWPFRLLPIYPRWEVDATELWQLFPWPIVAMAGWWLWTDRGSAERPTPARHALFALAFFLLMLLPILGFVTISYMRITWVADHFLYLPLLAPVALVAAGVAARSAALPARLQGPALAGAAAIVALLAVSSFRYAHVFAGEDPLWTHTLASNQDAWQAHNRLGARKYARGDLQGALGHFEASSRLRPDLGETSNNLGTTLVETGRLEEGIAQFRVAAEAQPHMPQFRLNLGNALIQAGRIEEAEERFRELTERFPAMLQGWNNLGYVLLQRGDFAGAIAALRQAETIKAGVPDVQTNLHAALRAEAERLARQGDSREAERLYRELLAAMPDDVQLLTNLGVVVYQLGRTDEAVASFRRALEIDPRAREARESLAVATGEALAEPPPEEKVPVPATLAPPAILQ